MVNLDDRNVLRLNLIVGSALEAFNTEILVAKHQDEIRNKANVQNISSSEIEPNGQGDLEEIGMQKYGIMRRISTKQRRSSRQINV